MTDEKEKAIYARFKFVDPYRLINANLSPGYRHLHVDDGWYQIIWDLCEEIEPHVKDDPGFHFIQVKEKFGTIRVYVSHYTDQIQASLTKADKRSSYTCEVCGKPGKLRDSSWLRTYCDDCHTKEKKRWS